MTKNVSVPERYKKTELGVIPEEWEVVKLGDEKYFQIVSGGTPSRDNPDFWTNGSINWATPTDITKNKGYFLDSTKEKINENGLKNSSAKIIPKGSVLLTSRATIGAVAINNVDLATNQGFANFVLTGIVCNYYLLLTLEFNKQKLESLCGQSTFKEVSKKTLKDFKILMPPLPEQQKIASILSKVDEQIEQTEQIIEKTETLKKGLMQTLLTKGIGHTEFKKTELGEIPEEWSIVKIQKLIDEDIIYPNQDGNHGELHPKSSDYVSEGIPFIMANNLLKNSVDLLNCKKISLEQANSLRIKPAIRGDILISHKGTIGRTGIIQDSKYPFVVLTPQVTYYRIKNAGKLNSLYLYYFFQSPNFQKIMEDFSKQSTRDFISISSQRKLNIIFPKNVEEQQKIASILSKVDSQIQDNQSYLHKLQELKKGLMQDLLTGKVRVCV